MGERRWTDEQLSAIEERSKTLLVCAAAGSGKTATLTERIIRSLTDEQNPVNIENLLCVTFTIAAASELKIKLTAALEAAVEREPENERLRHQLNMLPSAKIRTIDSFCNDILKMGADRVGLSERYRIADTAECELLAVSILEGLIAAVYRGELPEVATPEEFEALSDCLTDSKRTEELSDVFRLVYSRLESSELSVDAMLPLIEKMSPEGFLGVEKTLHGEYLFRLVTEFANHYKEVCERYARELSSGTEAERLYADMAKTDVRAISLLLREKTYTGLRDTMLSFCLTTKPRMKKGMEKSPRMLMYSDIRDGLRDDFKEKILPYFSYTEDEWLESLVRISEHLKTLYRFEKKFDTLFIEEKKRRAALSFADVERLCYECLIKDGEKTDIAINLARRFEAVYIDEYQDVNSLQNSIFEAISTPQNRFMVGDIKQSIYGFRSARPEIFASMRASFPPLSESVGDTASIFMSNNFRCDRGIVDFVNGIFDKVFGLVGESIGYETDDRLRCAKIYEGAEPEYKAPIVCIVDKKDNKAEDEGDEGLSEADIVAQKISELLSSGKLNNGKAPRPSDIAILIRSAKNKDTLYAEALKMRGIPAEISGVKSFFLSSEVLLCLCLLNSIDNPKKDIYLAGLLCSPIFSFDADDLCRIREGGEGYSLYESLVDYTEKNPDFEKGKYFLTRLDYYRTIAEGVGVDVLLGKLYRECGLMALASHSGGEDNLKVLYDYARSYESGAYKGLYNFINFINSIIDKKTSFDDRRAGQSSDAVKILTCHLSKGLEYPIVFLAGAKSPFSSQDVREKLVFSDDMGISFRLRTPSGLAVVESPIHDLTCNYILRKQHEEELRVLYVALTRAREQLYVVGTSGSFDRERYEREIELKRETLSPYTVRNSRSYLDIILSTMDGAGIYPEKFISSCYMPNRKGESVSGGEEFEICATAHNPDIHVTDELVRRFCFKYKNAHLTVLPEKLSVSKLSPNIIDDNDTSLDLLFQNNKNVNEDLQTEEKYLCNIENGNAVSRTEAEAISEKEKRYLPAFVTGEMTEESAKRGIATHMFLQFCNLESLVRDGAECELKRLICEGFLSERDGARVRLNEIERFAHSTLITDMMGAKSLYRELRFNVLLPACLFTEDEEKRLAYKGQDVLVQGVIDCIVVYPDGSIGLFDYKTDRLSRAELSDKALAQRTLSQKHSEQLSYYALAVEKMFGKLPSRIEVYSLPLGDTVSVDLKEFN